MQVSQNFYSAYGLIIQSDIELPELCDVEPPENKEDVVQIVVGQIDQTKLTEQNRKGPYLWAHDMSLWLKIPNVATFEILDGRHIVIEREPNVDDDSIRVFLLGSVFGALLFQLQYLVMHGNAIRVGNRALICVGRSGIGKSTLAAAFMQRGYPILADDVVPINASGVALPGFPRIKLWKQAANFLNIATAPLKKIRPGIEKFNVPLETNFCTEPLPVRWIYLLNSERKRKEIEIDAIRGMGRFKPLRRNTYRLQYLEGMNLQAQHLKLVGKLAGKIHLARLVRPEEPFSAPELVDAILTDIAKQD